MKTIATFALPVALHNRHGGGATLATDPDPAYFGTWRESFDPGSRIENSGWYPISHGDPHVATTRWSFALSA
jgi:hypothetical protein